MEEKEPARFAETWQVSEMNHVEARTQPLTKHPSLLQIQMETALT